MRTLRSGAFWLLAATLIVAHAIIAWHSLAIMRFWEDEAFNLTVPLNLVAGLGYTSDGALSGSTLTPFDPRISTGASVLIPIAGVLATGIDPVIGARLVPLAYWLLLLVGLGILGYRVGGRWAALVAVAVPLTFNSALTISPIQGPADLLGEIPAAAMFVWALLVLPRRAWLAGLFVGLAIQAKLIALLALPAFAVALWIHAPGRGWRRLWSTVLRSIPALAMAAVPTLLVELAALITFGPAGFIEHLRWLWRFIRHGGQNVPPSTVQQKITTMLHAWYVPDWLVLVVLAAAAVLIVGGVWVARRSLPTRVQSALFGSLVGLAVFLGWWSTAAHLPIWVRHPSPALYAFLPVLAAVAVWGARMLWHPAARPVEAGSDAVAAAFGDDEAVEAAVDAESMPQTASFANEADGAEATGTGVPASDGRPGTAALVLRRVVATACVLVMGVTIGASTAVHLQKPFAPQETLAAQRAAVEPIRQWAEEHDAQWLAAQPWGYAASAVVLAGAHLGMFDAQAMRDVPRVTMTPCTTETLVDGPVYRLCAAP